MQIDYSKSLSDIAPESSNRLLDDISLVQTQTTAVQKLRHADDRERCLLCSTQLTGNRFTHRSVDFISCSTCGHIQTKAQPPDTYPGIGFQSIYPALTPTEFSDRKKRIYLPKLEWILNYLQNAGYCSNTLQKYTWTELGAGAGYFLSCLEDKGIYNAVGIESNEELVTRSKNHLRAIPVYCFTNSLQQVFSRFPSNIYIAFFVLEHIDNPAAFFRALSKLPSGTLFVFSVPVFGISCIFEGIFEHNYARNLDGIIHTQMYTDASIAYALASARFEILAKWIFGQDAADMIRFILNNLKKRYPDELLMQVATTLNNMQDPLQACFDKNNVSDQRHIIARKI